MAGEVLVEGHLAKPVLLAGQGQATAVLALLRAGDVLQHVRFPLNFGLVLDRSFSMRGASLQAVKDGVGLLVDSLAPDDTLSIVSFKGKAEVIVPAQPVRNKAAIKAAVEGMRAWGGTKMSEGLRGGLYEVSRAMAPDVVSRLVVLTDGRTSGDEDECRELAEQARAWGVGIYPLGLGGHWDEALLDDLGQRSGGRPAEFVQQPADVLRVFQEQVRGAAAIAVRRVVLRLHLPKRVLVRRAVRVLPMLDDLGESVLHGASAEVALGDLERNATYGVLFDLLIEPRAAGQFRLGQVEVGYDIPLLGITGERVKRDLTVAFTTDPAQASGVNELVLGFAQRANAQRLVRQAVDEYRRTGRTTVRMGQEAAAFLDEQTRAEMERLAAGQVPAEQASVILKGISARTRRMTEHTEAPRRRDRADH